MWSGEDDEGHEEEEEEEEGSMRVSVDEALKRQKLEFDRQIAEAQKREAEERNKFEKAQTALEEQREKTAEVDDHFYCLDYGLT